MTEFEPSKPDPEIAAYVVVLLRIGFSTLAGLGIYHGAQPGDSALSAIAGGIVAVGMAIWGLVDVIAAKRRDHAGSVQSALIGTPMQPRRGSS